MPGSRASLAPSSNKAELKKYGDSRPALVLNSPKRNTPASTANFTKSCARSSLLSVVLIRKSCRVPSCFFESERHTFRGEQGLRSLGRGCGRRLYGCPGSQGTSRYGGRPVRHRRRHAGPFSLRREEGLLGCRPVLSQDAERDDPRDRQRRVRCRRPLRRGTLRQRASQAEHHQLLLSKRVERRVTPTGEV